MVSHLVYYGKIRKRKVIIMRNCKLYTLFIAAVLTAGLTGCSASVDKDNSNAGNQTELTGESGNHEDEEGVETVGEFKTKDVFGKSYTQDVFAEYDLTLVNVFTTWCSPCVEEIPELEKLRQEYEKKGIKLGIVAVVYDASTSKGTDVTAVEQAKVLYERSKAQFPFLIPDDGYMNGRLTGIESVPESFFVDKNGAIVSDPYIGANSRTGWSKIVDKELSELEGGN